jgi:hypothetical protein
VLSVICSLVMHKLTVRQDPETKAEKMKKKTDDMRRMFNLPDTESVIQGSILFIHILIIVNFFVLIYEQLFFLDYACTLRRAVLVPGRMFISQNYVCFYATLPETFVCPFFLLSPFSKKHLLV